jgi:prepilin-type N-terminal cleavage/methylation domain-containing protein
MAPSIMKKTSNRGFTLVEILIVMTLMGSIFAFGMVMSISSLARGSVIEERDLFVSLLLSGARSHAMANVGETSHGIYIDNENHEYVLFEGSTYNPAAPANEKTPFTNDSLSIENSSGDDTIVFEALSGNVTEGAGTITISGNDIVQELTISEVGQINW